jgi:hypothetical protein
MFTQTPPSLARLAATPVLTAELPPGFSRTKIVRLPPNQKLSTLGGVRIDFINAHMTESEGFALMRTNAAAALFARTEAKIDGGGLFYVRAVAVGRFVVGATGKTVADASNLLRLALAHFRRAEA